MFRIFSFLYPLPKNEACISIPLFESQASDSAGSSPGHATKLNSGDKVFQHVSDLAWWIATVKASSQDPAWWWNPMFKCNFKLERFALKSLKWQRAVCNNFEWNAWFQWTKNKINQRTRMQSRKTLLWNNFWNSLAHCTTHRNLLWNNFFEESCALYQFSPVTVQVRCRQWKVEGVGVPSVECEESGVLSGECSFICSRASLPQTPENHS